jgi:hypothetical protein
MGATTGGIAAERLLVGELLESGEGLIEYEPVVGGCSHIVNDPTGRKLRLGRVVFDQGRDFCGRSVLYSIPYLSML